MNTHLNTDNLSNSSFNSSNNKIIIKNKKLKDTTNTFGENNNDFNYVPLIHINTHKLWLDSRIETNIKILNNYNIETNSLYLSKNKQIQLYYNPTDYEIKQKHYYYDNNDLNIYPHPSNNIQKKYISNTENNNKPIIYVGIKNNTRRFYLDNIFRKLIDICVNENIRDPITGDYLINKNLRNNFYKWSSKFS